MHSFACSFGLDATPTPQHEDIDSSFHSSSIGMFSRQPPEPRINGLHPLRARSHGPAAPAVRQHKASTSAHRSGYRGRSGEAMRSKKSTRNKKGFSAREGGSEVLCRQRNTVQGITSYACAPVWCSLALPFSAAVRCLIELSSFPTVILVLCHRWVPPPQAGKQNRSVALDRSATLTIETKHINDS